MTEVDGEAKQRLMNDSLSRVVFKISSYSCGQCRRLDAHVAVNRCLLAYGITVVSVQRISKTHFLSQAGESELQPPCETRLQNLFSEEPPRGFPLIFLISPVIEKVISATLLFGSQSARDQISTSRHPRAHSYTSLLRCHC
jgi:hypothetical protein